MNNIYTKCEECKKHKEQKHKEQKECQQETCGIPYPNYDYKKVLKYMRMFQKVKEVSQFLKHETPQEFNLTEKEKETIQEENKRKFITPTTLYIEIKQKQNEFTVKHTPELYVLIMEHDVQLRERNGFMEHFAKHIQKQTPQYQKTFQQYIEVYAKNRMMKQLAEHEQWKANKAVLLNIELEDYITAYITTQILLS